MDRWLAIVVVSLCVAACRAGNAPPEATLPVPAQTPAAVAPVPPPPPPDDIAPMTLRVEFPDGRVVETAVGREDCATAEECWYMLDGFVRGGLRKSGLRYSEACRGAADVRACDLVSIGGVDNAAGGRWVMFRDGRRNPYPYNRTSQVPPTRTIVYRFLSSPSDTP